LSAVAMQGERATAGRMNRLSPWIEIGVSPGGARRRAALCDPAFADR
jgi:hypothetical protein